MALVASVLLCRITSKSGWVNWEVSTPMQLSKGVENLKAIEWTETAAKTIGEYRYRWEALSCRSPLSYAGALSNHLLLSFLPLTLWQARRKS